MIVALISGCSIVLICVHAVRIGRLIRRTHDDYQRRHVRPPRRVRLELGVPFLFCCGWAWIFAWQVVGAVSASDLARDYLADSVQERGASGDVVVLVFVALGLWTIEILRRRLEERYGRLGR